MTNRYLKPSWWEPTPDFCHSDPLSPPPLSHLGHYHPVAQVKNLSVSSVFSDSTSNPIPRQMAPPPVFSPNTTRLLHLHLAIFFPVAIMVWTGGQHAHCWPPFKHLKDWGLYLPWALVACSFSTLDNDWQILITSSRVIPAPAT